MVVCIPVISICKISLAVIWGGGGGGVIARGKTECYLLH